MKVAHARLKTLRGERLEAAKSQLRRGKALRYFSDRGGLMLGARRAVSGMSAESFGLVTQSDVDGRTVRKWEVRLRAATIASFRKWQKDCYSDCNSPIYSKGLKVAMHRLRADATNAAIWKKKKLHVSEAPPNEHTRA